MVQRRGKLNNIITSDRIKKLNDLGFVWNILEHQWNQAYEHLKQYVKDNGNAFVLQKHNTDNGFRLGLWVSNQRGDKKITSDRIKKLDELDFIWNTDEYRWNRGFEHLKEYIKSDGTAVVGKTYKSDDGFNLGLWAITQRTNKTKGTLSPERVQKLNDLGFV